VGVGIEQEERDVEMEPADLLEDQFADSSKLEIRIAFNERFSVRDDHPLDWVFDRLDLPSTADVLEFGCGPGEFWTRNAERTGADWTPILTDFSPAMVREARESLAGTDVDARFAVVEASYPPVAPGSVDAVVANLMLYHVPDLPATLREISRVLRPDGRLYALTVSDEYKRTVYDMMDEVADGRVEPLPGEFTLENGAEQLRESFDTVETHRYDDPYVVTDADYLVAYALSLPDSEELAAFDEDDAAALRALAERRLADGPIEMQSDLGLFVAEP
jgi:ubiquinone/menaquinone biosynthesis C-methylase UbiE